MTAQEVAQIIQEIIAPVVMISSCAILVSGILARYAELNLRLRAMAAERLQLLRTADGELSLAATKTEAYKVERLTEIDAQAPALLRRHELLHNAVLTTYGAILALVLCMFVIAWAAVGRSAPLANLALILFLVGMCTLLVGLLFVAIEVRASASAVRYEIRRVLGLGE